MATITSTASGLWSAGATWVGGVAPGNDDAAVIAAGHVVDFDVDSSGYALGFRSIIINGGATPGTLRVDSTTLAAATYYMKIQSGYTLSGTTSTNRGRLLANSDGVWGNSGSLAFDRKFIIEFLGTAGTAQLVATDLDVRLYCVEPTTGCPWMEYTQSGVNAGTDTITLASTHYWQARKTIRVKATTAVPGGTAANTTYYVRNPSGATLQLEDAAGTLINLTDAGTGTVQWYEYLPGIVRTYKSLKTVSSINTTTNVITLTGAHGWSANTAVVARSSGLLPAGVKANTMYYVGSPSGADLTLLSYVYGPVIDITDSGSGTIELYDGHTDTATKVLNVLDDVTGDPAWTTAASHNRVVLCDAGPVTNDRQADTMATIAAGAITITAANVDSAQYPNSLICLVSRNITLKTNTTTGTYVVTHGAATFGGNVFQNEVWGAANNNGYAYGGSGVGSGHTVAGSISGVDYGISGVTAWTINAINCAVNRGLSSCTSCTMNGPISGCGSGLSSCTSCIVNGPISGCGSGFNIATSCTVNAPVSGCNYGINSPTSCTVNGPVSGCGYCIGGATSCVVNGPVDGAAYGLSSCTSCTMNGPVSGVVYGGFHQCTSCTVNGPVSGCSYGARNGSLFLTRLAVFSGNTYDLYQVASLEGYGASLGSASQNGTAAENFTTPNDNGQINVVYDIGTAGTPNLGGIRAWTAGGNTSTPPYTGGSVPASPPVALDYAYKMTGEASAAGGQRENFVDIPLWGKKDTALTLSIYEICNSTPSTFTAGPTFELLDPDYLYGEAAAVLDSATAQADGGNDTAWHTLTLSYTPAADRPLTLRVRMKDTAKFFHWAFAMTGGYGGGGGGSGLLTHAGMSGGFSG